MLLSYPLQCVPTTHLTHLKISINNLQCKNTLNCSNQISDRVKNFIRVEKRESTGHCFKYPHDIRKRFVHFHLKICRRFQKPNASWRLFILALLFNYRYDWKYKKTDFQKFTKSIFVISLNKLDNWIGNTKKYFGCFKNIFFITG